MESINLQHGSGGEKMTELLNNLIFKNLGNEILNQKHDGAFLELSGRLAFSTDSFVVSPIFFKGGNIGELAVFGTVNDISMCGAEPKYLSLSFIIEEGFAMEDFEKIIFHIFILTFILKIKIYRKYKCARSRIEIIINSISNLRI